MSELNLMATPIRKGQWVRYSGQSRDLYDMVGQVISLKRNGFINVSFRSRMGGVFQYGCAPIHLTPVGPAAKATEIACRAMGIKGEPEPS